MRGTPAGLFQYRGGESRHLSVLGPDFGVRATENLAVKVSVRGVRDGLGVDLPADLDAASRCGTGGGLVERDLFRDKGAVERGQMQGWVRSRRRSRGGC